MPWGTIGESGVGAWRIVARAMQLLDWDAPSFADGDLPQWDATAGKFVGIAPAFGSSFWSRNTATAGQEFLYPLTPVDKVSIGSNTSPASQLFVTPTATGRNALVMQKIAGQTADFLQCWDEATAVKASINNSGRGNFRGADFQGAQIGGDRTAYVSGVFWPRFSDLSSNIVLDYQDDAAFLDKRANTIITFTPTTAASSGTVPNLFRDDTTTLTWNAGTNPYPLILEMDMSANPIGATGSGAWSIGLTFRSDVVDVNPTQITIEIWNGTAYVTQFNGAPDLLPGTGQDAWVSARFLSGNNLQKVKITLSGPSPVTSAFRIQRVIFYHETGVWDPWHLHRIGGSVYGNVTISPDPNVTALTLKQGATPTVNPLEIQTNAGVVLANFDTTGKVFVPNARINTFNGILKGVGGDVTTATPTTDYVIPADLSGYVIIAPLSSARNVIQPLGDFIPLTLMGTPGSTADLFQIKQGGVTPTLVVRVDPTGKIFVPNARINTFNGILKGVGGDVTTATPSTDYVIPADLLGYVILAPTTSARNVVQPTTNAVTPLTLRGAVSQSNPYFEIQDGGTARELQALPGGHLWILREMRFGELAAQGANYVGFKAPDALTTNFIWVLPATDGAPSQFLKTDGLGNLGWATAASGGVTDHAALTGLQNDDHNTVYAVLHPATNLRNVIQPTLATLPTMLFRGAAAQSADLVQWQDSAQNILGSVTNIGQGFFRPRDGATNTSTIALTLAHHSTSTPANNFGAELRLNLNSSSTPDQLAGSIFWEWVNAANSSRTSRMRFVVNDFNASREGFRIESDSNNALLAMGGNILTATRLAIYSGVAGNKGLVIQQAAIPTANPFEIQSSVPAVLANFDTTGKIFVPNARISNFNGILKGVGGDVTTAVLGTDYIDASTLGNYVILAPATSARNVIVPTSTAVVPLNIKGASGQVADLLQIYSNAGVLLSRINADGQWSIGDGFTVLPHDHMLRIVQSAHTGTIMLPETPIWIDQNIPTVDAGGAPDVGGINLRADYQVPSTNPTTAADLSYTGVDSRITYGTVNTNAAKGTVHTFTSVVDVVNSFDSSANEFCNYFGYTRFRGTPGTSGSVWFSDWSVHGPINTQPGLLNGTTMLINNYFNGVPIRGPSAGMWIITQPGAGAGAELGHSTATTYPVEYGLAIIGSSTGGVGFRDAIHIGSGAHPWKPSGASSLERGIHIEGVTSEAIRLVGNFIGIKWGNESAGNGSMRIDRPALYELQLGNATDGGLWRVWGREGAVNDPVIEGKTTAVQALAMRVQHGTGGTLNSVSLCLAGATNQFAPGSVAGDSVVRFTTGRLLGSNGTTTQFLFSQGALQLGNSGTDPSPRAILDLSSITKGVIYPRWTTTQRLAITPTAAEESLWGYDSTLDQFFFWNGTAWVQMLSGSTGTQNWTSAAGVIYPTTNTDRVLIGTTTDPGAGISLGVFGVATTNDPLAQFYTNGAADSNAILLKNGTASLKFFMSGATNTFMPGTVVGDAGIIPSNGRLHFGTSTQAAWLKIFNGNTGIGMPQGVDPAATFDVRGKTVLTAAGTTPDLSYPAPLTITKAASNTAQYINFIRAATTAWGMGMLPNSNIFAIGGGNANDNSFISILSLDLSGRLLVGRSGAPNTGYIAEFYSDPAAPKALGVPIWNNQFEQGGIAGVQAGMFGYRSDNQTLQYHDLDAWRILARADQLITIHASLLGLEADDHPGYFWMSGRQFVQILIGGTQPDADLVLQSTSHGVKGLILFGSSGYNEATNRLGLRTTNPLYTLDVNGDVRFSQNLTGILRADNGVLSVDTAGATQLWTRNNGGAYLTTTTANDKILIGNAAQVSTLPLLSAFAASGNNDDIFTAGKGVTRYMVIGNNGGIVMGTAGSPVANQIQANNARIVMTPDGSGVHLQTASTGSAGNVGSIAGYITLSVAGVNYAMPYYNITTPAVPAAPSGLDAVAISSSEIDLTWTDNSSDETSFRVERSPDGSSFGEINSTNANTPNFNNTGLTAATTYYYRVRARNAVGDSPYSNIDSATTLAAGGSGIIDDFNRGNQAGLGTPTGGQSLLTWSYVDSVGTASSSNFSINTNRAAANLSTHGNYAGAYLSNQTASGTVKVTAVTQNIENGGVLFRYDPGTKTGYVLTNLIAGGWRVYLVNFNFDNSSFYADYRGQFGPAQANGQILEVIMTSGSSAVDYRINGVLYTSAVTGIVCPNNLTFANHGIYCDVFGSAGNFVWDDYSFVASGGGGGSLTDDFSGTWPNASGGQTWGYTGTWQNTSGQGRCIQGSALFCTAALSGLSANGTVQCTISAVSGTDSDSGLLLRASLGGNTGYVVTAGFPSATPVWRLYYVTGMNTGSPVYSQFLGNIGTGTVPDVSTIAPAAGQIIKVVLNGSSATVYINSGAGFTQGCLFANAQALTNNTASASHGLHLDRASSLNENMRWDDFSFTP